MTEGGGKKKPLDIIDHMTEHLSSYDGRYLVIPGATGAYPSYYPYLHQPFLYHQQIHPHYYTHRGYGGGGESGGCLIENMVGNWSPDLSGTYSPFGGGVPPQPPPPDPDEASGQGFEQVLPPGVASSSLQGHSPQAVQSQVHIPGGQTVQPSPQHQTAAPKKQRIVAEVKPLRPSYSDVVSKSSAPPLSPATKTAPIPANSKTPAPPQPPKEQSRPKTAKQSGVTQPNFSHQGGKESKRDGLCDDIFDTKKKKNQEWNDGVKAQDCSKQNKQYTQTSNKKNKQSNKQSGRDEKSHCGVGKGGSMKRQNAYYSGMSDVYRKYVAASDDEQENEDDQDSDEEEMREPSPPPRQRLHHAEPQSTTRKHTGVKVERTLNSSRTAGKSKRSQRSSKRKDNKLGLLCKKWQEKSSYYLIMLASWLINLLVDVAAMSAALLVQLGEVVCRTLVEDFRAFISWFRGWWSKGDHPSPPLPPQNTGPAPLQQNIQLPTTGEEAMKRLLSCKGKDPYSILGLTSSCTDEEIRRYYRSQALLVHPDKNSQPGAEEAFKILVHAFDLIAEPEKRAAYDRYVSETNQVEQAWSELSDLLTQLHEKMHYAATTIRCNNCGKRHKRTLTERPVYAARFCAQCNIHHSAKEGDMWCEVGRWLFSRRYLACMEGSVYEITDWARCQGGGLADLVPHAHSVHYRVLLGGVDRNNHTQTGEGEFEDLLSSIYGQSGNQPRNRMSNRRKGKKSK